MSTQRIPPAPAVPSLDSQRRDAARDDGLRGDGVRREVVRNGSLRRDVAEPAARRRLRMEPIAIGLLLAAAAAVYLIGLGSTGWGNDYYAAAAQAGAQNSHALFYGASDVPASITVDKPPASIWLMAASVRLFGLSPFTVLLPQALLGIGTVGLVYATARRVASFPTALLAGGIVLAMPITALVFRYDNPDALLTMLLALSSYAIIRAVEHPRFKWLVLVGIAFGLGFLTKQLQAFLTVPGFVLCHLIAAPVSFGRRLRQVCVAAAAAIVTAGWWVAAVELTPASARPFIGGSQTNSFLELTFGYNGLGRILGRHASASSASASASSTEGALRTLTGATGLGVAWLLPAAVILSIAALVIVRHEPRTNGRRALIIASLTGLLVSDLVFSYMNGIYHSYYTAAMVPALALTIAVSAAEIWDHRHEVLARSVLAATVGLTAAWAVIILPHAPESLAPVTAVVAIAGGAATVLLMSPLLHRHGRAIAALAVVSALVAPASVALATASTAHNGSGPIAGYASTPVQGPDPAVVSALAQSHGYDWAAATLGSRPAGTYQLASGQPVMPIGGFTHRDPSPTLDQFTAWVSQGRIHWYIGSGGEIGSWVAAHYSPVRMGDTTVYDLSAHSTSAAGQ